MSNTVYKLKIKKSHVGSKVPFPLTYIFSAELIPVMQKSFSSFIGFPFRHHINIDWSDLKIDRTIQGVTREDASKAGKKLGKLIPDLDRKDNPWHIAVPILNRSKPPSKKDFVKKNHNPRELYGGQADYEKEEPSVAGYLKDDSWDNEGTKNSAYPPTTYFATSDQIHAPICSVCPRLPFHKAGKCAVGDPECFEAFRDHFASNMFSKLREYDLFLENLKNKE